MFSGLSELKVEYKETYLDSIFNFPHNYYFFLALCSLPSQSAYVKGFLNAYIYTYIRVLIPLFFLTPPYCQGTSPAGSKQEISISKR